VPFSCLLVDDSEEFLASASRLLDSQGVEIVGSATNGAEAVRLAQTLAPDVALVDIQLGDEDGIELTHKLETHAPSTRVVLVSSYDRDELGDLIAGSPAVGFLSKNVLGAAAISKLLD